MFCGDRKGKRMKTSVLSVIALALALVAAPAWSQVIVADSYNVTGSGTGFALNAGVNSGINPPTTRLTGTAATNLRYITTTTRAASSFDITSNKLRVTAAASAGRFVLSANGITSFDFAPALGTSAATPGNPVVYDLMIRMANSSAGVQRFSFALGTAEGDANAWAFGIQVYRTANTDNYYTLSKRVDTASSGLAADVNTFITNTAAGTYGTQLGILMRVTDAGSETGAFNSRVQLSLDGGFTWSYDTQSDPDLPNGWRLHGAGRHIIWDVAPNAGTVTYDDFSVRPVPVDARTVAPADATRDLGPSVTLSATVSNQAAGNLTVTFYGREAPKPYPGPDFCVAVLPDTQNYAREAAGNGDAVKEMWFSQTDWMVTNRVQHNLAYVAHLGDIVQNGDIKNGNPNTTEWRNATNAMYRLENPAKTLLRDGIPYGMGVGNHDQEPIGEPDAATDLFNQFFGVSRFAGRSYFGGRYGSNNDNHYDLFSASGLEFIVFYFEFGRYGSSVLNWANAVLATNQNRRCIVVTHYAGGDTTPCNLSTGAKAIYDGLKAQTNFFLMLGGHVFNNGGEGSRSDTYQGRTIRTFISNYQGRMNGGNGWMRLMYFSPSNSLVTIKTFSPWLNQYETDANSQMTFSYKMTLPTGAGSPGTAYVALGTNSAVAPGSQTSLTWSGLQAGKSYDWHVKVTDAAGNSAMSPACRFATLAKFTPNTAPVASNLLLTVTGDAPVMLTLRGSDTDGDPLTFQVLSQPLNGLITDFDSDAGAVTYLPARGYRGPDRITYVANDGLTNSAVATFNLVVVAPPDANGNGIADAWETAYGITDPNADNDNDGQSNLAEYRANTNPTNAASALRIVEMGHEPTGEFRLVWSSVGGTRYRVQYADAGPDGGWEGNFVDCFRFLDEEMDSEPHGEESTQSFNDFSAPANGARFYRLQVIP